MEQNNQKHLKIGQIGEDFAVQHLRSLGFKVLDRNYWKTCGEIDIVVSKDDNIHFVEVKTVTREILDVNPLKSLPGKRFGQVNRETYDDYEPEDNVHLWKRQRLGRVIVVYLQEKGIGEDSDWQCDLLSVYLDKQGKLLKIECIEDIVLS